MKTDELISMLATGVTPVDPHLPAKRFATAVAIGAGGALLLMLAVLGLRHDLATVAQTPLFWAKVALPLAIAIGALRGALRLARPGARAGGAGLLVASPVAVVWIATLVMLALTPADERLAMVLGQTWKVCPFAISMLSIPGFVATLAALRSLAPTRLALAGAAGGLLSGAGHPGLLPALPGDGRGLLGRLVPARHAGADRRRRPARAARAALVSAAPGPGGGITPVPRRRRPPTTTCGRTPSSSGSSG